MIIGILDGLEHLHTRKIIHRDLKPGNVLLQGRIPRLSDFDISRVMAIDSNSNTKSGTYWYMSPEAHQGKRNVQTDIWSIGVILFQLLKGDLPFPQKTLPELLAAVTRGEAESLPDCIPVELKDILSKAIAVDLAARYQTAKEMSQALKDISPDYSEAKTISDETITEVITVNEITETATPNPQSDSQERRLIPYRKEDRWGFCDENKILY